MGRKNDRTATKAYLLEMQIMWKRNGRRKSGFGADMIRKKYKIGTIPIPDFTDILENEITEDAVTDFIERKSKYYEEKRQSLKERAQIVTDEVLPGFENESKSEQAELDFETVAISDNIGLVAMELRRIADAMEKFLNIYATN